MAESSIPVDLLNPGQVFACLGFLEAANTLLGDAEGAFDWSDRSNVRFLARASGTDDPVQAVLEFLRMATAKAVSPVRGVDERDGGPTVVIEGIHPCKWGDGKGKVPNALLPLRLSNGDKDIVFDYWCDLNSRRPALRLWTATNGNSAFVRFSKLHKAFQMAMRNYSDDLADPFNIPAPVAANFRLELRRNWTALNLGFSPDKLAKNAKCVAIEIQTYPVVELLAALGLTNARPREMSKTHLEWGYGVWGGMLPVELARAAISTSFSQNGFRRFQMHLEAPNDGGDLSISYATEETRV